MVRANQRRARRRLRNRNRPPIIPFVPKLKYENSSRTADGIFVISKRKRAPPTEEEKERKRQKQIAIKTQQVALSCFRHKVIGIYNHGMHLPEWQFGPKNTKKIIEFLQATTEKYCKFAAAKSFVYRTIAKYREAAQSPDKNPFRDRRGENRASPKRKNAEIITLCDELLSEPKMTAPKVVRRLLRHGHRISKATVHRIAKDLCFRWTKPWYTDILTNAQKLKRKIFCRELLRLTPAQLLNRIGGWLWTDEKWWDIVGPGSSRYIKALSQIEAKLLNQVKKNYNYDFFYLVHMRALFIFLAHFFN